MDQLTDHSSSARGGTRQRSLGRLAAASAMAGALAFAAVSCGGDADEAGSGGAVATDAPAVTPPASSAGGGDAVNGERLSRSKGCAGCHGQDFGGGAGPTWVGLAGSEVTLADGSTVSADAAYLARAIAEPSADLVADYTLKMPANGLSDAEIADIVAFIDTLADG